MSKLKIVLSALIYPFTMAHFFWRAFERRDDVELFVIGPFSDTYIPWANGMYVPKKYVKQPHFAMPFSQSRFMPPYALVKNVVPWKPDLWVQIDAGFHFSSRPDANVVAHVQTDPHVLKEFYTVPSDYSDYNFSMQEVYRKEGEYLLPYAYDPEIHFPEDRKKEYHACLIGLHYDQRDRLVKALRDIRLDVYYSIGEVYDVYRQKYNESSVALSWSSKEDLPSRVWEAFGMRLPLVANRTREMARFFNDGEHYLGFNTVEEGVEQVRTFLLDEKFRNQIAQQGYENAKTETWDKRVQTLLEICGLL